MDDDQQEHVADVSLLFPQGVGGALQVLSGSSVISRQFSSSDSSSTLVSPSIAERKRKRMEVSNSARDETSKKIKTVSADQGHLDFGPVPASHHNVSLQLPAEMWQHIFSFLSPHTLGALLRVNKLFNKYLDPTSPFKISAPAFRVPSIVPALHPDAIWRASRCLFWPRMPTPLSGKSELDMWRFACSRSCQVCGQIDETNVTWDSLPWQRGPGNSIVSPIFVFFVNSCGKCLAETSVKEVDVLLSTSIPSVLISGLPMAFLTPDLNVVYTQSIRTTQVPTSIPLTRLYWPTQVESLRLQFEDVKRFGPAAAEEWIKGLEARGADAIHEASRWEKWYLAGGVCQMLMRSSSTPSKPTTRNGLNSGMQTVEATTRPKRRAQEGLEELESHKRADIEARAARLQPPIPPDVLVDLPSFQVALQNAEPLRDKEWNNLKQQLMSQYKKMKKVEKQSALAAKASEKHQAKNITKKSTEPARQGRHDAETLVRMRISTLTDQFINNHLDEGRSIERKDYAQFIIGVLAYIRKQFYAEFLKIDTTSLTPRLTLHDMKWIFDNKIKQIVKGIDQDLFFCRNCPNSKPFGFHAVIQHYLSKHAGKKMRNRHWKAEWPEDPLFWSAPIQQTSTVDSRPPSSRTSEVDDAYKPRIDAMAKAIKSVWKIMKHVENIPHSAKVFVSIYHVAKDYQKHDPEPVSLETFLDVLKHFKSSSILSTYHGLACKVCVLSQKRDEDGKGLFTLPTLAKHFHDVHDKWGIPLIDWRVDLIWLPDMQISQDLQSKAWKSKRAFELTSEALPWLFESEKETSQGGPLSAMQNPLATSLEAVDTASAQINYRPDERFFGDVPSLLPASAVYFRSGSLQKQPRYDAAVSRATSTNERMPQAYEPLDRTRVHRMVTEPGTEGSSLWGSSDTNSWTFSSREVGPEPRRHLSSHYPYYGHNIQMVEGQNGYLYYPDAGFRREQSHIEAGNRYHGSRSRYYMPSGHQQPIPSAPLYHYSESAPSYDRYDTVDTRRMSNGYYTQHPTIIREYRILPNADRFDYASVEPHRSATPSQRAYDTYASRYA
ncbi:hypothetical protein GGI43DRAFT_379108 [Trichoderma evansii]